MKTNLLQKPRRAALAIAIAAGMGATAVGASGCSLFEIDDRADPNGPSLEEILANPTRERLANLAVGVEASSRVDHEFFLIDAGVIGREYWRTSSADPRFTADLLGKSGSVLDDNTFYLTRPWAARYRAIRTANTLLQGLEVNTTLSAEEKAGGRGWAQTWKAYQYLMNLNLTYENGIRFIEPGESEGGPLVGYDASLAEIAALLDEGAADLAAGGDEFFFDVSSGFDGLDTPAGFRQVNRALAARVAVYRGDYAAALTMLGESFLDAGAELDFGAYHVYSTATGDLINLFFLPPQNPPGNANLAHPSFVADAEPADTLRTEKVEQLLDEDGDPTTVTFDGLTTSYGVSRYESITSPIPIIRNAELILLRAEARWFTGDVAGATADLNTIRAAAGLDPIAIPGSESAFLDALLYERRYELYAEGHRWVDMRRFGRLGDLPIDREGDDVWSEFPIPEAEDV
jgi:hypothetical protein